MAIEYSTRKTMAKGMLDVALLLSNASRLKHLLRSSCFDDAKCISGMVFLCISIVLQCVVGVMLIILARFEQRSVDGERKKMDAESTGDGKASPLLKAKAGQQKPKSSMTLGMEDALLQKNKPTLRLNTAVLLVVFIIVVLNVLMDGLDLSASP